jgi:hypothetical protein
MTGRYGRRSSWAFTTLARTSFSAGPPRVGVNTYTYYYIIHIMTGVLTLNKHDETHLTVIVHYIIGIKLFYIII